MAATATPSRRSNKQVATAMVIVGIALIVVALIADFSTSTIMDWIDDLGITLRDWVYRAWSLIIRVGTPVGGMLIVGAIIVNRLPEPPRE